MVKLMMSRLFAVAFVCFLATSTVIAQEQPERGRGPRGAGGFGGGGFGGGFGSGMGRPDGALGLLSNEAIQTELKIDADTKAKLTKLAEEARAETRAEMEKAGLGGASFAALRDLPEEERRAKMDENRKKSTEVTAKITTKYTGLVKEVVSKEQFTRAEQIALQSDPIKGLTTTEIAKELDLSAETKEKIAALSKELDEKRRGLFTRGGQGGAGGQGGGFEAMRAKIEEINKERDTKLSEILGDKSDAFAKLKGEPFDMSKLRGGFGGGRGGRGGEGGRPRGNRPAAENN